eukprot:357945-Chlamydomonas_euryale.AAC.5
MVNVYHSRAECKCGVVPSLLTAGLKQMVGVERSHAECMRRCPFPERVLQKQAGWRAVSECVLSKRVQHRCGGWQAFGAPC